MNTFSSHLRMTAQGHSEPVKLEILGYQRYWLRRGGDYVLRFTHANGKSQELKFQPRELVSRVAFNDRLNSEARGIWWNGPSSALDRFLQSQLITAKCLPRRLV
jgi:hypothetical protein